MHGLNIYMADGTMSGSIIMSSPTSIFNAVRVKKMDVPQYINDLNCPGVYMLLIGNDTVYVGQSGLNTIGKRIFNTHSGNIDNSWHTVVGFGCKNQNISGNTYFSIEKEYTKSKYDGTLQKCLYVLYIISKLKDKSIQDCIEILENSIKDYLPDEEISPARKMIYKAFKLHLDKKIE